MSTACLVSGNAGDANADRSKLMNLCENFSETYYRADSASILTGSFLNLYSNNGMVRNRFIVWNCD